MKSLLNKVIVFFLCILSSSAWSVSILDQSFEPNTTSGFAISDPYLILAQTFTSGQNGELSQIDIFVSRFLGTPSENLNIMILGTTPLGVPDIGQTLASASLTPLQVPESTGVFGGVFLSLDMTAFHLPVTSGEILAIAVQTNQVFNSWFPLSYVWEVGNTTNPYIGGSIFSSIDSGISFDSGPYGDSDFGFRTYVSAIPEPETFFMLMTGLCLLGFIAHRNKIS